jgi:hypothetical protein
MTIRVYLCWLVISCIFSQPVRADVWVGGDNNCQFQNIQQALDLLANGTDSVVKIANNVNNQTYNENLILNMANAQSSLLIQGGYDVCQGTLGESPAVIDGGSAAPVLVISGTADDKILAINKLVFTNGLYDVNTEFAGGINVLSGGLDAYLTDVTINQNSGFRGGGLYLNGGDQSVFLTRVNVFNNTAQNGGGLACDFSHVFVLEGSAISFNTAQSGVAGQGNGGGAYVNFACFLGLYAGDDSVAGLQGMVGNQATGHGGGVYVANQGVFGMGRWLMGDVPSIRDNQADADGNGSGNGGALFASGLGTLVGLDTGVISGNSAVNGGGLAADQLAQVDVLPSAGGCFNNQFCTTFDGNSAGQNVSGSGLGLGGAFFAQNEGRITVRRSNITGHQADNAVVAAVSGAASVSFSSSVVADNGGVAVPGFSNNYLMLAVDDNSSVALNQVTVANNVLSEVLLFGAFGALIQVNNSIIQDAAVDILEFFDDSGQQVFSRFSCSVLHELQSINNVDFNQQNIQSTVDHFADSANRNYHLNANSPAIDLCASNTSSSDDMDGQTWGFDDPNVANIHGVFDAGADEYYGSDVIFADRFES